MNHPARLSRAARTRKLIRELHRRDLPLARRLRGPMLAAASLVLALAVLLVLTAAIAAGLAW